MFYDITSYFYILMYNIQRQYFYKVHEPDVEGIIIS